MSAGEQQVPCRCGHMFEDHQKDGVCGGRRMAVSIYAYSPNLYRWACLCRAFQALRHDSVGRPFFEDWHYDENHPEAVRRKKAAPSEMLAAAAPELADALETLLEAVERPMGPQLGTIGKDRGVLERARDALRKAGRLP